MKLINLATAVELKFGKIYGLVGNKVAVLRDKPTFEGKPYMTISWAVDDKENISFYWGHYDLTKEEALADIAKDVETNKAFGDYLVGND